MDRERPQLPLSLLFAFHLCVVALGIFLQNLGDRGAMWLVVGGIATALVGGWWAFLYRAFVADVLVSRRSAGVILGILAAAGIAMAVIPQGASLRAAGYVEPGLPQAGARPVFLAETQSGGFALRIARLRGAMFGNEPTVGLSESEAAEFDQRVATFGADAAQAWRTEHMRQKRVRLRDEIDQGWAAHHFESLYSAWRILRIFRLYEIAQSWWFVFLLLVLALHACARLWMQLPFARANLGWTLGVAGLLTLLCGLAVDRCVGRYGTVALDHERMTHRIESKITDLAHNRFVHLPYRLHLTHSSFRHRLRLRVSKLGGGKVAFSQVAPARAGDVHKIEDGAITLTVLKIAEQPEGVDPREVQARVRTVLGAVTAAGGNSSGPLVSVVVRGVEAQLRGEKNAAALVARAIGAVDDTLAQSGRSLGYLDATVQAAFDPSRPGLDGARCRTAVDIEWKKGETTQRATLVVGGEPAGFDGDAQDPRFAAELEAELLDDGAQRAFAVVDHFDHRLAVIDGAGDASFARGGVTFAPAATGVDPRDGRLVTTLTARIAPGRWLVLLGATLLGLGALFWCWFGRRWTWSDLLATAGLLTMVVLLWHAHRQGHYAAWSPLAAIGLVATVWTVGLVQGTSRRRVWMFAAGLGACALAYAAHGGMGI